MPSVLSGVMVGSRAVLTGYRSTICRIRVTILIVSLIAATTTYTASSGQSGEVETGNALFQLCQYVLRQSPLPVMARLFRATYLSTLPRQVARRVL